MQNSLSELPRIPRWRLDQQREEAELIYHKILKRWAGVTMDEQSASFLVDDVCEYFGLTGYRQKSALVELFAHAVGKKMTEPVLMRVAAQLEGNRPSLVAGVPIKTFEGVSEAQWVPFYIESLYPCLFGSGPGIELKLLCVAGPYSGLTASKKCPVRFLARIAYSIGFSKRLLYDGPEDLLGLMFVGYILPSSKEELDFQHYDVSSSMKKHNRDIIKTKRGIE